MALFDSITKLQDEFDEEIEGVENYQAEAMKNQSQPQTYKLYSEMAKQELQHAQNIQRLLADELNKIKTDTDPSIFMEQYCDHVTDKMNRDILKAKAMLGASG